MTNDEIRLSNPRRSATLGCIGRAGFVIPYRRVNVRRLPWFGVLLVGVVGCGSSEAPKVAGTTFEGKAAEKAVLQVVKSESIERAIAAHKGEVVVVDIWAEY
jgi:hypothetical protein